MNTPTTATVAEPRLGTGLQCEEPVKSGSHYTRYDKHEAAYATSGWNGSPIAICKMHASAIRRRSWSRPDAVQYLSDELVESIKTRQAETKARNDEARAIKQREAAERDRKFVADRWREYPTEFTSALVLQTGWDTDLRSIDIVVYPVGDERGPDSWDAYHVELRDLDSIDKLPAYVSIRANTLTPHAAIELAKAIEVASEWASALNAR